MNPRSKRRWRYHVVSNTRPTNPTMSGAPLSAMARRPSWGARRWALVPLVPILAILALFVLSPRGTTSARATPAAAAPAPVAALVQASSVAHRAEPARLAELPPPGPDETVRFFNRRTRTWEEGRVRDVPRGGELVHAGRLLRVSRALGALSWAREVDVAKLAAAEAPDDPKAAPRYPEAGDVVEVFGEAGYHTRLGDVRAGERVVFRGRLYETRAAPGEQGLEVRPTGLRLERVTRTYVRRSPTLVDLTIRYGDGRGEATLVGTPEHPFFVPARGGYVPMGELVPGTVLQTTDGSAATVAARSERHGDFEVHNLEVEHAHNYFVSPPGSDGPGVLVHNATYGPGGGPKPNAKPGSAGGPTAKQPFKKEVKDAVRAENREKYGGKLTCEHCGRNDLVEPGSTQGGIDRPRNEAQVDHIIPSSKRGDATIENGQVLCTNCNQLKRDR